MAEGHRERLKKQFAETDFKGMQDHALLELLLTYAIPRRETNSLAHALIDRFGSLEKVAKASVQELQLVDGIGQSAAVLLRASFVAAERIAMNSLYDKKGRIRLRTAEEASRYAMALYMSDRYETVRLICLDKNFYVLNTVTINVGTLDSVTVNYRKVIEQALNNAATNIILMHNHPTGIPIPSVDDNEVFHDVQTICKSLGLTVLDFLIIGEASVHCSSNQRVCYFPNASSSFSLDEAASRAALSTDPCARYNLGIEALPFMDSQPDYDFPSARRPSSDMHTSD